MALTEEQKEILDDCTISDVIEYYGNDKILNEFTTLDIALYYDLDSILDEYSSDNEIASYLDAKGFDFSDYAVETEEYEVDSMDDETLLIEFCRRFHPHGILMKQDIKEIINNYIDDNLTNKCY